MALLADGYKKSLHIAVKAFKIGIDLLLQALGQLPSAQPGLTTLFGMGRGDPRRNRHHKLIDDLGLLDLRFVNSVLYHRISMINKLSINDN